MSKIIIWSLTISLNSSKTILIFWIKNLNQKAKEIKNNQTINEV